MKKLLCTAFICIAINGQASELPSCDGIQKLTGLPYGAPQDPGLRQRWQTALEEKKDAESILGRRASMALLTFCGIEEKKDVPKALRLWELAHAQGDRFTASYLALAYAGVFGEVKDEGKALKYLLSDAKVGSPKAAYGYGKAYIAGDGAFLKQDHLRAEQFLLRAASQGWVDAYAVLGSLYIGQSKHAEAMRWLELVE
jgi:TPR repeat protein